MKKIIIFFLCLFIVSDKNIKCELSDTSKKFVKYVHPAYAYPSLLLGSIYSGLMGGINAYRSAISGLATLFPHKVTGGILNNLEPSKKRKILMVNTGGLLAKSSLWLAISGFSYKKAEEIRTLLKD